MKKNIIKNCPSIGWTKKLFKKCKADCTNHKPSDCSEIPDCLLKRIVELCKNKIEFCKKCSEKADLVYDCTDCNEGGEAHLARAIISNFLGIEEEE